MLRRDFLKGVLAGLGAAIAGKLVAPDGALAVGGPLSVDKEPVKPHAHYESYHAEVAKGFEPFVTGVGRGSPLIRDNLSVLGLRSAAAISWSGNTNPCPEPGDLMTFKSDGYGSVKGIVRDAWRNGDTTEVELYFCQFYADPDTGSISERS